MEYRWSHVVVVLCWLSTMSWLVVEKVLPPLERGEPPNSRTVYGDLSPDSPAICWDMTWNEQPIGWAMNWATRPSTGMTEIHSHVHFRHIPLEEMTPIVLRALVHDRVAALGDLPMDATSRMEIDPLNRLSGFRSAIRVAHVPDAIVIQGTVEGSKLKVRIDAGEMSDPNVIDLPQDLMIGDGLSPQTRMPGLHPQQTWTVPVYNPLRLPDSPMEILQACVEGSETIVWNGTSVRALLVIYRSDSGSAFGTARAPRGRLWVDPDGMVLRQEVFLFNSRLTFTRLAPEQATELAKHERLGMAE